MNDKIIERVRRLLAMAADSSSPEEAAIAARRASSLMETHSLSKSDIIMSEQGPDGLGTATAAASYRATPRWYSALIVPVADLYDCKAVYTGVISEGNYRKVAEFQGMEEDALVATWTLDYLANQIELLATKYRQRTPGVSRSDMSDFRYGCAMSINRMLRLELTEKRQRAADAVTGTALVVRKQELVEARFGVARYRSNRQRYRHSAHHEAGRVAGENVSLRQGVNGAAQRRVK